MFSVIMIPRTAKWLFFSMVVLTLPILAAMCQRVPLLAPSGSTITLTTSTTALAVNGSTDVIAQVLEPSGTPPQNGTHVSFTTTLGTVQPSDAETDVNGRVQVKFLAGTANGTATITAISGGATTGTAGAIRIAVGTAAVGRVSVNASPATVPSTGGSATITATVYDINGNPLTSAPVSFSTTAGTLSSTLSTTDGGGVATTTLQTSQQATVTASVGAQAPPSNGGGGGGTGGSTTTTVPASTGTASGSVTVNISAAPTLVITPPATPPSAGLPSSYTFVVTVAAANGSAVRDLFVNWGDGQSDDLGAVTGTGVVAHVYNSPGTYVIRATVTDASGNTATVSAPVTVIPVATPTIIITASVPPTSTGTVLVTFQIQVTPPTGVGIQNATIDYGDGKTDGLGGLNGSVTVQHPYVNAPGPKAVTVTVLDTLNRTTRGSTTIVVP
jgi:adhesin/invasin